MQTLLGVKTLDTARVVLKSGGDPFIINKSDFNKEVHKVYEEPKESEAQTEEPKEPEASEEDEKSFTRKKLPTTKIKKDN